MAIIRQSDFIESIEDALQYISYYHPLDFVQALEKPITANKAKLPKCHRTGVNELQNVSPRAPSNLPRYWYCYLFCESWHGSAMGQD